jgi:hypothetical protein
MLRSDLSFSLAGLFSCLDKGIIANDIIKAGKKQVSFGILLFYRRKEIPGKNDVIIIV